MNRGVVLKFWQLTAITSLLETRRKANLIGAVLGDTVGLGKTWETVGFMLIFLRLSPTARCILDPVPKLHKTTLPADFDYRNS